MERRPITLTDPLTRGWDRMVEMLFRPFDAAKWIVVAFSAWLAGLADGGGGGLNFTFGNDSDWHFHHWDDLWHWIDGREWVLGMLAGGILFGLALLVVVLWLSSRGKFVFVDNVVHDRGEILNPWREYASEGNSLFVFRLVVILVCLPIGLALVGGVGWLAFADGGWLHDAGFVRFLSAMATATLGFLLVLALALTLFFLDAFVVPLMHRHRLGVIAAWRRFFGLFGAHPWWFLACALLVLVLALVVGFLIFFTGVMTCCVGFLLLAIPFVGTVFMLPILAAYRAFTIAFLSQFDSDTDLRERAALTAEAEG